MLPTPNSLGLDGLLSVRGRYPIERERSGPVRTKIFITIDTEFSIGGAFADPRHRRPLGAQNVLCDVAGRSEGLGFMLETFDASNVRATFFVEALQTAFFGDAPMGELARRIAAAGHDAQLHLHPVWTYFDRPDWAARLAHDTPVDNMHGRAVDQLAGWMQRGVDTFARWRLPPPVALRTGNLMVDRNVYLAMAQVGLRVASNVSRAVFEPAEAGLRFNGGIRRIDGVTELPVLTYAGLKLGSRCERKALTITGTSFAEARCLLDRAHAAGCGAVVLLTHCHEFVNGDLASGAGLRANRSNQRRLVALCRHLHDHVDRFEVATMNDASLSTGEASLAADPLLAVPAHLAVARMVQNKLGERNAI